MEEGADRTYHDEYRKDDDLYELYSFLEKFGYETGDEELAILNGTHELYDKGEAAR